MTTKVILSGKREKGIEKRDTLVAASDFSRGAEVFLPAAVGVYIKVQSNGGIGFPACAIPEVIPLKLNVHFDCDLV
jgi:hypothetical protein